MSTSGIPLIRYLEDYEVGAVVERKRFQIHEKGSGCSELYVAFASGKSTEFLIRETYIKLEDIREEYATTAAPWNWPHRFNELKHVLIGDTRNQYDSIVARDYPDQADKTNDNYEEL